MEDLAIQHFAQPKLARVLDKRQTHEGSRRKRAPGASCAESCPAMSVSKAVTGYRAVFS